MFSSRWNFPNCCGAIDGKHIQVIRPSNSGSEFYNYKRSFSIILFALVDGEYCFKFIDVGANGRASDAAVFRESKLNAAMLDNSMRWSPGAVIISDDAFPLRTNLLKPFNRASLTIRQRIYNYRLSRARRVVENAFGVLASRFRVFSKPIAVKPSTVDFIVKTCCSLHNWLRQTSTHYFPLGTVDMEDENMGEIRPGSWRSEQVALRSVTRTGANNYTREAVAVREQYADYFMGDGQVSWQNKMIGLD